MLLQNDINRLLDEELTNTEKKELDVTADIAKRFVALDLTKWKTGGSGTSLKDELQRILEDDNEEEMEDTDGPDGRGAEGLDGSI